VCHVSVGHVARVFEGAGLVTSAIYVEAFAHYAREMRLPRVTITPHPMGRPLGPPGDGERHREVVHSALGLVDTAVESAFVTVGGSYRPGVETPDGGEAGSI